MRDSMNVFQQYQRYSVPNRLQNRRLSISRGTIISLLIAVSLILSGCSNARPKLYHVGVLSGLSAFAPAIDGFKARMTELGYVEGTNITYDIQSTEVDIDAYRNISKKFVTDQVDLIFVFPTEAAAVAKETTQGTDIPVVFALAFTDVPTVKLIDSIREPGGNITGVRFPSVDIASQRLHFLLEMAPDAKRILVPYLTDYPNVPGQLDAVHTQAASAGVEIVELAASSPPELQAALDKYTASGDPGIDAILMIAEPLAITPPFYSILGKFSYEQKIPIGGAFMNTDDYDSLFGLLPDAFQTGRDAALLADKIFKGSTAGQIPVITSESYFQISLKAAKALDVTVPDGLLKRADAILR
jgi:putative tryptophan/tyrosine transport system substrate-binding protein